MFCRLKKVQGKKKRDTAARDALQASKEQDSSDIQAVSKTAKPSAADDTQDAAVDLLADKDVDVIF
jgi:V-type H+-transporting ATPase subunit D